MENLTSNSVAEILKETYPKQNDYGNSDYVEELQELLDFGIETKEQLIQLLEKHKAQVLSIDAEDIDEFYIEMHKKDNVIENVDHKVANGYWFALPGLLRITLELEFKDEYVKYADIRDGI